MNHTLRMYYTAVLGALGGLLGWWIMGQIPTQTWSIWLANPLVGAGLGLWIGACIAATDGAIVKRVPRRALRDGALGGLGGAIAGLAGLFVAGLVFLALGGGFSGRIAGWMLFGGVIGLSDLLVTRQPRRALFGLLGGLAGGGLGGLIYEGLTQLFLDRSDQVQIIVGGVGMILLGASIGALIPLARRVLAHGTLRVLNGDQAGLEREVIDTTTIGRYDGCEVYLPDPAIAWRHACVRRTSQGFSVEVLPQAGQAAQVGDRQIAPGESVLLRDGERIQLGGTVLEFVGR